jgi:hypothetical protein
VSLQFIVGLIESLVLAAVFEADGLAMESYGEHHWGVERSFQLK